MPKTHIVIPARYQSSRLPGKPLLKIHGKPMILHVANKALKADFADDVLVATDHQDIAKICDKSGIDVVMTRIDHESGTDRLAEVSQIKNWDDDDIVVNMQGDEPLVPPKLLKQCRDLLLQTNDSVMATLCEPILDDDEFNRPSVVKVVTDKLGHALYFSRSPIPCDRNKAMNIKQINSAQNVNAYRHLGIYAYKVGLLKQFSTWPMGTLEQLECLEQLRILENGHKIAVMPAQMQLPTGVDTAEDLERINQLPAFMFE